MITNFTEIGESLLTWGAVDKSADDAIKAWLQTGDHRLQVSLLSAILVQLQTLTKSIKSPPPASDSELLKRHGIYMQHWYDDNIRTINRGITEVGRVLAMCCHYELPPDCETYLFNDNTIHVLSRLHSRYPNEYHEHCTRLFDALALLKKVNTLDDFKRFSGVGPATLRKIKAFVSQSKISDDNTPND